MPSRPQRHCGRRWKRTRPKHDHTCSFSLCGCRSEPFTGESVSVFAGHAEPRDPFSNRFRIAGYGLNGQRVAILDWSATWIGVGATDNAGSLDGQPCETAGLGCYRFRPSVIVSAGRACVCMDAIGRSASDLGASELLHGIRCLLSRFSVGV